MSFLNPILLFGTAGIGIPILIHLLNRRRFRKLPWAAMRYLKASVERNQRRMKLQDWILLAIRCLLIVLVAIALARPSMKGVSLPWLGSEVSSIIVLDRSASMAALSGDGSSRFDEAKAAALSAVRSLPAGSAPALMLRPSAADAPAWLNPSGPDDGWERLLENLTVTAGAADLSAAIPRALDSLVSLPGAQKEIVIITDRQQDSWGDSEILLKALQDAGTEVTTHVVLTGEARDAGSLGSQLAVSSVAASQSLPIIGRPLRFDIAITNHGAADATAVPVRLELDGEPVTEQMQIGVVRAGQTVVAQSYITINEARYHHVSAFLPDDSQPADNQRTTVLQVFENVRLLVVDSSVGTNPAETDSFFLRHALATTGSNVSVIEPGALNQRSLDDAVAVFLTNVPEVNDTAAIRDFVRGGGGLVIFPGDKTNADFYNRELAPLLPAKLGEIWAETKTLQTDSYLHPIVTPWSDPGFGSLAKATFQRGFSLTTDGASKHTGKILSFQDGSVALAERTVELGKSFLFASSANKAWNDLPARHDFVPLLSRVVESILHTRDVALHVEAGTPFALSVGEAFAGKPAVIFPLFSADTSNTQGIQTSVASDGTLRFDATLASGAYEATIAAAGERLPFSVQPVAEESRRNELTTGQIDSLRSIANVIEWKPGFDLGEVLASERVGTEFWKLLLACIVALAVAEAFLAQRFSRSK